MKWKNSGTWVRYLNNAPTFFKYIYIIDGYLVSLMCGRQTSQQAAESQCSSFVFVSSVKVEQMFYMQML